MLHTQPANYRAAPRALFSHATWAIGLILLFCGQAAAATAALDPAIADPSARDVIERHTVARQLQPIRFLGTLTTMNWLMDRPALAATLARHLHPGLERYDVTDQGNGVYAVDDHGALRGNVRLVLHEAERRVYLAEGQFHSLAELLTFSGTMVFALTYREHVAAGQSYVEMEPQLYLRLHSAVMRGIGKLLSPLVNAIIDRRIAGLTEAARIVSERLTKDAAGLYDEMQAWLDLAPGDLADYRRAFVVGPGIVGEAR
jgi:hypothetical protein